MGNMTASFRDSLAASRPATSSHLTLGLSERMAPCNAPRSFLESASSSSLKCQNMLQRMVKRRTLPRPFHSRPLHRASFPKTCSQLRSAIVLVSRHGSCIRRPLCGLAPSSLGSSPLETMSRQLRVRVNSNLHLRASIKSSTTGHGISKWNGCKTTRT